MLTALWLCASLLVCLSRPSAGGVVGRLTEAQATADADWIRPVVVAADEEAGRPRRIVPKSLFVAPGRQSLSCSSGYRTDSKGRCVKLLWVDSTVHLHLLVQQLSRQFGDTETLPSEVADDVDLGQQQSPFKVVLGIASDTSTTSDRSVEAAT